MVFLVGARRSGTNWLQRIVTSHPATFAVPSETHIFSHGLADLADRLQHGTLGSPRTAQVFMERDRFVAWARRFCDELFCGLLPEAGLDSATLVVERTPLHVHHLDLIGAVYPDAAVVHIVRDGRDVARSLLVQGWKESSPADAAAAAEEWASGVRDARAAAPDLAQYREVRYERLLGDTEAETRALFEWLDLDASPAAVEAAMVEARSLFNVDRTMPFVGQEKWQTGLTPEQLAAIEAVAGPQLEELGYELSGARPAPPTRQRRARPDPKAVMARVRRRRPAPAAVTPLRELELAQYRFDNVMQALRLGQWERVADLVRADAEVVVVGGGDGRARGAEGLALLRSCVERDGLGRRRQIRGDVYAAAGVCTGVFTHADAESDEAVDTTIVMTFGEQKVRRLTYYRFPLSGR